MKTQDLPGSKIMSCDQVIARARIAIVVGIAAVAAGFPTVAAAQSTGGGLDNLLASPSFSIPQAPVGHRQPHQADLPEHILRDEQGNTSAQNNPRARAHADRGQILGQPGICVAC